MKEKNRNKMNKNFISALLLCFILMAGSIVACIRVTQVTTASCFRVLEDSVKQLAADIEVSMKCDEQQMQIIADMLADHTILSRATCQNYLTTLKQDNVDNAISSYSILLPDNETVYVDTAGADYMDEISDYEAELERLPYLSDRFEASDGEEYVVYAAAIKKGNMTRGILYGYVRLSELPGRFSMRAFGDNCQMYIVDGDTGDFLMDTWHDSLGNMFDGSMGTRKTPEGFSLDEWMKDVAEGEPGYIVFESRTTGDNFYTYYYPVGKYNLSVQINVPQKIAFADAVHLQWIVYGLSIIQMVAFISYLANLLRRIQKENRENRRKLKLNQEMYQVQQTLFDAYKNPYLVTEALKKTSQAIMTEYLLFIEVDENISGKIYTWPILRETLADGLLGRNIQMDLPECYEQLIRGKSVCMDESQIQALDKDSRLKNSMGISVKNVIIVPVLDSNGRIKGTLNAINVSDLKECREALEMVARDFLMSLQNIESYQLIRKMGTVDILTELKNRNSYQKELGRYDGLKNSSLCCLYFDANGLHELNNHLGHTAGDAMLMFIGNTLKGIFGADDAYRIGGDEFVVFCIDMPKSVIEGKLKILQRSLSENDYHVSCGMAFREENQPVNKMITEAEKRMYEEKKRYYHQQGKNGKSRVMNQELEKILLEKEDRDSFLTVISTYFLGVYIVNLDTDDTRVIYKPDYFAEILEENDFQFRTSIRLYAERFIVPEDLTGFCELFDYERIINSIEEDSVLEHTYRKMNGSKVRVRIMPTENYSPKHKNTLWIFESCV